MNEKQQAEDFNDADDDTIDSENAEEEVDFARLARDIDVVKRRSARQRMPALRKLELLAEQRRTAELTSDFDDYRLDEPEPRGPVRIRLGAQAR